MLNKAVLWGWIEKSPFKRFVEERQKIFFEEGDARERILTEAELKRLFDFLDKIPKTKDESRKKEKPPYEYLKNIISAALLTGLRRGDILKLKWDNIDFETKTLRFWEEKKDKWRTKPLCSPMIDLLNRIPRREKEYIFTGPDGQPVKDVKRAFRTALKKAGVKDFRFHDLRRSSASFLLKMGSPLPVIQKHLGHTSLDMTQKYAHLSDQSERMELEKLAQIFPVSEFTGQKLVRNELSEDTPVRGSA
jgi:integrase